MALPSLRGGFECQVTVSDAPPPMVDARRARTRAQGMLVLLIITMHQNLKFPDF